jgi:hypothetical protein
MKNYETAEKPTARIEANIKKQLANKPIIKVVMTKVFRGEIDGKYKVFLPGETATGKDAEYIKKNHPGWIKG